MARIEVKCPKCGKHTEVIKETRFKHRLVRRFKCNHLQISKVTKLTVPKGLIKVCKECLEIVTNDNQEKHLDHNTQLIPDNRDPKWTKLYEYQKRGVEFIERSGFKCLNADEMGLGKTAQALMTLRYNYKELTPCLIVAPAGHIHNWHRECLKWINDRYHDFHDTPIVHVKNTPLMQNMKVFIISNMMISKKKIFESILQYGFKWIIIDESHHFKNDNSNRTQTLIEIAKVIEKRHPMSGTSVENRVGEYFNTLHLCNEYHWPHRGALTKMCLKSNEGKILSIAPRWKTAFNERISGYVIRRTKKELFKELPPITINKTYINVQDNPRFVNVYNDKLDELEKLLNKQRGNMAPMMEVIALIRKLWEYTALAKAKHVVAYAQEFLENTKENGDSPKLCLGGHHRIPRAKIVELLSEYHPIQITDQPPKIKDANQEKFSESENRLCVASILGAGEGRNLHFCHNVIIYERYWNPLKEKQFIGRFYARGIDPGKTDQIIEPTIIDFLLATDTIDEFFSAMNELKMEIFNSAIDKDYLSDSDLIFALAEKVVAKRLKYVGG